MITVYTLPGCIQCRQTIKYLRDAGEPPRVVDLSESPMDMEAVRAMGYSQAPVVVTGDDHWSGFRPDKLMLYVNRPRSA
ncbi:glutaredoxin family protein [Sediminivirga luteola]|uniref:Glutaredoxin-like protein NrdH n=1 Tax=Sediminivirga luteola TaxID=1774748 RepID=A0A8J2TX76_9MICO|nr:glutaredoxin family protein [Sediminivirga luteola]GGA10914.1 glutaredoxin-like protein NrdH [Sediminivirga luteola]